MIRPILLTVGLAVVTAGACTQSYDDFDFSGTTTTAHGGGTTTTTSSSHGGGGTGGTHQGGGGTGGTTPQGGGGTGPQGGGGTGGQGGSCDFTAPNDCGSATDIGQVVGDQGTDVVNANGVGSEWLQAFVAESNVGPNHWLSYTVTLTSPPGASYDLYVQEGDQNGTNCGAAAVQGSGDPQTVTDHWADSTSGSFNDGRYLSIEVRHVSGNDCINEWQLTVAGYTVP